MSSRFFRSLCQVSVLASLALLPMGCKKPPPVTLACQANPPAIFPGDTVTATATAGSVDTKKNTNVIYDWSGTGVTGSGTTATVNTASLAPGSYTVKATVKEGKKGKEGLKPGQTADCSASFTVKEFEPPTLSCSASPSTLKPGETSTVTATGLSPQNRPLTYSYYGRRRLHQRQRSNGHLLLGRRADRATLGSSATWPTTRAIQRPPTPA